MINSLRAKVDALPISIVLDILEKTDEVGPLLLNLEVALRGHSRSRGLPLHRRTKPPLPDEAFLSPCLIDKSGHCDPE